MFGRCSRKVRVLNDDIVKYDAKNWMNISRGLLPKFAKVMVLIGSRTVLVSGYVSCSRQTPKTKRQQYFHSEGPRIC